jgi:hypothetical protein
MLVSDIRKLNILLPDSLHFHERNFASLFTFFEKHKVKYTKLNILKNWLSLYGDYSLYKSELLNYCFRLEALSKEELFALCVNRVNIFKVCRAELLTFLMPKDNWFSTGISNDLSSVFEKAYAENKEDLILNMAATLKWIDYWRDFLSNTELYTHCFVFGGSTIYTHSLMELLKTSRTTCFVLESFFTGNEYYFEERYTPIANASKIRKKAYYNSIELPSDFYELDKLRIKAQNKVRLAKNKNVVQPKKSKPLITNNEKTICIIGQVVNDFALIEANLNNINSISIYKNVIKKILLETSYNVVFKAHPWERKKVHVNAPLTLLNLKNYKKNLIKKHGIDGSRFILIEDYNIKQLVTQVDHFVLINSQAGIELALEGIKPIVLGDAFYSKHGFTHNYASQAKLISDIVEEKLNKTLTLDEYDKLEVFLMKMLMYHLVCVFPSGVPTLESYLLSPPFLGLEKG